MTETKLLRAESPTDLLACVPTLLGFHPDRSVVMITSGPARVPVHARVDLPGDPDVCAPEPGETSSDDIDAALAAIAEELADVARRNGVSAVAVVLYTGDAALADAAGRAMAFCLADAGVDLRLVMRADGQQWWLHRLDGSVAPGPGTPYELSIHPLTVQATLEGRVVHRDREALRASVTAANQAVVAEVEREAETYADRLLGSVRHPGDAREAEQARAHLVAEGRWVQQRIRGFLGDRRRMSAADTGRLLVALLSIEVRDVAWAQIDHDSALVHVDLWRDVVRHAPRDLLAAPAALLAFSAWIAGDGALAWCALDRCHEADPGYSMAGLVTQALVNGVPPRAWHPFEESTLTLFAQ